jgi:hypothetical protein
MEIEYGKLLVLFSLVVGIIILMAVHAIDSGSGLPILTTALGYTVGNGRLASKGKSTVPMLGRRTLRLSDKTDDIELMLVMGQVSPQQAINMFRNILAAPRYSSAHGLSDDQRHQLQARIRELHEADPDAAE